MRLKTLMRTEFATVSEETSLEQARMWATREGIDVPVMRAGALVGLLRARDVERFGASTVPSVAVHDWAWREGALTVEAALSRDPVSLTPDASVHEAARLLDERELDAVPIVDSSAVVGVVATRDLLGMLIEILESDGPASLDHVLVVVDLEGNTRVVVEAGLALARQHGARLTVAHVRGAGHSQLHDRLLERLAALVPPGGDVVVRHLVMTGDPASEIALAAARHSADVIVVGGRSGRWLGGPSLAEALVDRAPCPVLVVPADTRPVAGERSDDARA
jgi:CBS domain-containing protein